LSIRDPGSGIRDDAGFGYVTVFAGAGTLHVIAFVVIVVAIRQIPDRRAGSRQLEAGS
jgi:hypothetical protein